MDKSCKGWRTSFQRKHKCGSYRARGPYRIQDTIDEIDKTGFAEVVDLSLSMPGINLLSSALIRVDAVGKEDLQKALDILKKVSAKKDLLMVLPIDIQA